MRKFLIVLSLLLTMSFLSFTSDSTVFVAADEDMPLYIGG